MDNIDIIIKLCKELIPKSLDIMKEKDWNNIKLKYTKRAERIMQNNECKYYCLFDYIVGTQHPTDKENIEQTRNMIKNISDEIDKACNKITSSALKKFEPKLYDIIKNMICTMDENIESKNEDFKNRINELFAFNCLLECEKYELIDMERKLPNGKSVDFVFKHRETSQEILIEVVTMQYINPSNQDNDDSMNSFLKNRIKEKYNEKICNLEEIPNIRILPFIEYHDGMEKFNISINRKKISFEPETLYLDEKSKCHIIKLSYYLKQRRDLINVT